MAGVAAARMAAYRTLSIARERDAYVRELVNSSAAQEVLGHLKAEDRAFARRLALGVCATSGTLDEALDRYIAKPSKVAPGVRDALRISAYELLFLDKPAHVVVSQGVELVRSRAKGAAGLANAVLRRVAENAQAFMAESPAHRCGIPAWLYDRLTAELGEERALDFANACLEPAPVYVANVPMWVSDRKAADALAAAGLLTEPCEGVPGAWRALDAAKVPGCSLVEQSQVIVADYAAQAVAFLAAPEPGDRVLEVGSGRGTKTILMAGHAHRAQGAARIWALDTHAYKAEVAAKRLEAARVVGVQQVTGDACKLDEVKGTLPEKFDHILVDAPCSGTGTLRRHPEITWSVTPEAVTSCAELQLAMLRSVAPRVAPGGQLTYATCSVLREEDEAVLEAFLAAPEGAEFEVVPVADVPDPRNAVAVEAMASLSTPQGFLRTYPKQGGCDGHFCAVLRRKRG